ncbi:hypothetical protein OS42_09540 [Dickeya oryzae]
MIDPKKLEQIARQVQESMPKGIREFGEDMEKKIRQILQSQLGKLDLVSREEFDLQTQVLLRTREKTGAVGTADERAGSESRRSRNNGTTTACRRSVTLRSAHARRGLRPCLVLLGDLGDNVRASYRQHQP